MPVKGKPLQVAADGKREMILPYQPLGGIGDHPLQCRSVIGEHARGHRERHAIVEETVRHLEPAVEHVLFAARIVHVVDDEIPYRRLR